MRGLEIKHFTFLMTNAFYSNFALFNWLFIYIDTLIFWAFITIITISECYLVHAISNSYVAVYIIYTWQRSVITLTRFSLRTNVTEG